MSVNYRYYLTQPKWDTAPAKSLGVGASYRKPDGAVGMLDLRSESDCGKGAHSGDNHVCFAWGPVGFNPGGAFLGQGDIREIPASQSLQDTFVDAVGVRPAVDGTLVDMLFDAVTNGGSPDGGTCPVFAPSHRNVLALNLAGHSKVKSRRYRFGEGSEFEVRYQSLRRRHFERMYEDDPEVARKNLGMWMERARQPFGNEDAWKRFVPQRLQRDIKSRGGPRKPETSVSDNFNRGDSSDMGANWNEFDTDLTINTNALLPGNTDDAGTAFYTTALSSDDHWSQCILVQEIADGRGAGVIGRKDNNATITHMLFWADDDTSLTIYKFVAGTPTAVGSSYTYTFSNGMVIRGQSDGSNHTMRLDGNVVIGPESDATISGNVYVGVRMYKNVSSPNPFIDEFQGADLTTGSGPGGGKGGGGKAKGGGGKGGKTGNDGSKGNGKDGRRVVGFVTRHQRGRE